MAVKPRGFLLVGTLLTTLGLALAGATPALRGGGPGSGQPVVAGVIVLLGWGALVWGIHSFGRSTAD
jgi:hypothetical protein